MKYSQQDSQFTRRFTDSHATEKRSVAETLLETINETLGQGGLRPAFSKQAARRGRRRQLAGALAMLTGLAALGVVSLSPASEQLPAGGEPVAFLEIARGRAEMSGGPGAASMMMLAGGEAIHAGAVIETATASGVAPAGRAAVRLAGGQSMRLDSGSRVRFATSSSVVLERGAVYVDSPAATTSKYAPPWAWCATSAPASKSGCFVAPEGRSATRWTPAGPRPCRSGCAKVPSSWSRATRRTWWWPGLQTPCLHSWVKFCRSAGSCRGRPCVGPRPPAVADGGWTQGPPLRRSCHGQDLGGLRPQASLGRRHAAVLPAELEQVGPGPDPGERPGRELHPRRRASRHRFRPAPRGGHR